MTALERPAQLGPRGSLIERGEPCRALRGFALHISCRSLFRSLLGPPAPSLSVEFTPPRRLMAANGLPDDPVELFRDR